MNKNELHFLKNKKAEVSRVLKKLISMIHLGLHIFSNICCISPIFRLSAFKMFCDERLKKGCLFLQFHACLNFIRFLEFKYLLYTDAVNIIYPLLRWFPVAFSLAVIDTYTSVTK